MLDSVEPLAQQVRALALAGAVDAAEEQQHREVGLHELRLRLQQLLAQDRHALLVFLLRDRLAQLCRFEHRLSLSSNRWVRPPIVKKS